MRFAVRSGEEKYEAKWWLEDDRDAIFRFELPENTISAWRLAAKQLLEHCASRPFLDGDSFLKCEFFHDFNGENPSQDAVLERVAFCKFLLALKRELEQKSTPSNIHSLEIFQRHPQIADLFGQAPYCFLFLTTRGEAFLAETKKDEGEWGYYLEQAYQANPSVELISDLVGHYDLLREFVHQACRKKPEQAVQIAQNYAALVKAILHFLDVIWQDSGMVSTPDSVSVARRLQGKYSPRLAALLVENEALNMDERQKYLNMILAHPISYPERFALLRNVLMDLIEDVQENLDSNEAMQTIASLMSQYCLNRYDLDNAVSIWEQVSETQGKKDWILKALLYLYKHPLYFIIPIVVFITLSFLPDIGLISSLLLFAVFLVLLFGLFAIAEHFLKKQGFSYLELFLPRLFGSIVVGLSILALENTVWEITLDMAWGNWALTALATYLGSLAYLFLDIHKHTRLLTDELDSNASEKQRGYIKPMARSVRATFKIFAIGLLEAVGLTTIVSALIPFNALGEAFQSMLADGKALAMWAGITLKVLSNHTLIYQIFGAEGLTLSYFPKLIVLWSGLSLLIGAFVQLLWQDRQITAS